MRSKILLVIFTIGLFVGITTTALAQSPEVCANVTGQGNVCVPVTYWDTRNPDAVLACGETAAGFRICRPATTAEVQALFGNSATATATQAAATATAPVVATPTGAATPQPVSFTIAGNAGSAGITILNLVPNLPYTLTFDPNTRVSYGPSAGSATTEGLDWILSGYNIIPVFTHGIPVWTDTDATTGRALFFLPCSVMCVVQADANGQLELFLNDNMPANNSGYFTGTLTPITVTPTGFVKSFYLPANAGTAGVVVTGLTAGVTYSVEFRGAINVNESSPLWTLSGGFAPTTVSVTYNLFRDANHGSVLVIGEHGAYSGCANGVCTFTARTDGTAVFTVNDNIPTNNLFGFIGVITITN